MKKHRVFAIALAVLLLVQLAPVPAFAGGLSVGGDVYGGGDFGEARPSSVHVASVKKTWLYADGAEIPADELAALIDQGVIPESVDIFYVLLSSDDSQVGFAIPDKYHDAIDAYMREHYEEYEPGMYGYDICCLLDRIFVCLGRIPIDELENLGWNADGWLQWEEASYGPIWLNLYDLIYDDDGNPSQAYINLDDIVGWSKQTLSQDNNWRFGVCPFLHGYGNDNYVVEFSDSEYDKAVQEFGSYAQIHNLHLNPKQAWDEAGEVLGEVSYSRDGDFSRERIVVSRKEYDGRYLYKEHWTEISNDGETFEFTRYYLEEGVTFTNTYNGEKPWRDITVTKTWEDNGSGRPRNITVRLLANGEEVKNATL
ncbi:MAG: Cna B-type domain-containing protein, partial [Clostridia bacterium]|nr:Cna B-type domain-containing protein [Clostridia bacterium]